MAIKMPHGEGGPVQAVNPLPGGIDSAPISVTAVSTTSTNGAADQALYVISNVHCHIRFDGATATTNDALLPSYTPMVFLVTPGAKVSVIAAAGDGLLYVHDVETL